MKNKPKAYGLSEVFQVAMSKSTRPRAAGRNQGETLGVNFPLLLAVALIVPVLP
jgi:hypothetical protein